VNGCNHNRFGHNAADCHHNRLQKSTKKKKEIFNPNKFGKCYCKEQQKKKTNQGWNPNMYMSPRKQLETILPLLRQAMLVIMNNAPNYQRNRKKPPMGIVCMVKEEEEDFSNFTKDTWCVDGAASTHMGNLDVGMFQYEDIDERVTVGNGKTVWARK
jgi:hypothetical protein